MKKVLLSLICLLFITGTILPQPRGKIIVEPVTPHRLETLGLTGVTNSVSNGLNVIAKKLMFIFLQRTLVTLIR